MDIKDTRPVMADMEDYIEEIKSIWDTKILTNNGKKVEKLKKQLADYLDCENIDLFVNGHSALMLAIKVMDLQGEVITSPFTFVSTTNAIVQNGLVPVFGDIDDSYNLSPKSIESLITPNTCAIITPHIFGIPCDVGRIGSIAKKHNLKVIYDGAQAFGTKVNGRAIGCFGDAAIFSFHAIKVFNSIEGGMAVYQDNVLHKKFEQYRNFGISYGENGNEVEVIGINAKMNEFQAAMGIVNLKNIEHEHIKRKKLTKQYCELLKDIEGIQTYRYEGNVDYNYAYFPIKILPEYGRSRDDLWQYLKANGIGTRKLYDKLTCDYRCYKDKGYIRKTENADKVKKICLDLPMYGTLSENEVCCITDRIRTFRG